MSDSEMIGGAICHEDVGSDLIYSAPGNLDSNEILTIWDVIQEIGRAWNVEETARVKTESQFRECVKLKSASHPSYLGEYKSALLSLSELKTMYGSDKAFELLFFQNGILKNDKNSRLSHLKRFVVDELIAVVVVSGGFKAFGAVNNQGYIGGSRFRLTRPYRVADKQL